MGDPKLLRKKYSTPTHPWQKARIEEERGLTREYGFKNKKELWKLNSKLRAFKSQVKDIVPKTDEIAHEQKQMLLKKLQGLGLIDEKAILEDILALTLKDLCERRLQTIVFKKGLARSIKQARQLIVHEHVVVGERKITSPSYILDIAEESLVNISKDSPMISEDHPERVPLGLEIKKEMEEIGLKKKEPEEKKKEELKKEPKEKEEIEERQEPQEEEKKEDPEEKDSNKDEETEE